MMLEQLKQMKEELMNDIVAAIDKQRVSVGEGICVSDVIGILEVAKLEYMKNE